MRRRSGGVWWAVAVSLAVVAGCTREPPPQPPEGAPPLFSTQTFVFRCEDDYRFIARVSPDTAIVHLGDDEVILPNVVSASGARFSADDVTFWSKGPVALLEAPGIAYSDCIGQMAASGEEASALLAGDGPSGIPLAGVEWRLMSVEGVPAIPGIDEALPSLRFEEAERRIAGSAGCNRLMGTYRVEGDGLRFTQLATTRMACHAASITDQERRILEALERSRGYLVWGDILSLLDGDGSAVARYTAGDDRPAPAIPPARQGDGI